MTSTGQQGASLPPFGNLNDFVYQDGSGRDLEIEVAVKEDGRVAIFHNKPFKYELGWLEYDLSTHCLQFVMDDGDIRDVGLPLGAHISKNMQNTHQVLMVLMDGDTGQAKEGYYVPVIIHKS